MQKLVRKVMAFALALWVLSALNLGFAAEDKQREDDLKLSVQGNHIAQADLSGSKGKFSMSQVGATVSYSKFTFSYNRRFYDWDDKAKLPFGDGRDDPWGDLSTLTLMIRHDGKLNNTWRYFMMAGAFSSFEKEMSGSYGGQGMAGFTYVLSPIWQFSFGGAMSYHPIRTRTIPVIGLNYNMGAKTGWSGSVGYPVTQLVYRFNPTWALEVGSLGFSRSIHRLADDSKVEREGYMESERMLTGAGLEYSPVPNCKIALSMRYYFNRQMTIYDKDGNNQHDYDVDNAWGGTLSLKFDF